MAKNGFYHQPDHIDNGGYDLVRCVFCDIHIYEWQPNDDPNVEHQKANPDCLFAKLNKPQTNLTPNEFMEIVDEKNSIKIVSKETTTTKKIVPFY